MRGQTTRNAAGEGGKPRAQGRRRRRLPRRRDGWQGQRTQGDTPCVPLFSRPLPVLHSPRGSVSSLLLPAVLCRRLPVRDWDKRCTCWCTRMTALCPIPLSFLTAVCSRIGQLSGTHWSTPVPAHSPPFQGTVGQGTQAPRRSRGPRHDRRRRFLLSLFSCVSALCVCFRACVSRVPL